MGMVGFYILFTLLPNSNSMMVKWPWVFIWQVGLMLGPIAILSQLWQKSFRRLGGWLNGLSVAWCFILIVSAIFSEFSQQAFWYSWAAICSLAYLYSVNSWLISRTRVYSLLIFQGILSVVFSTLSLSSWYFQTVRPYLAHLEDLKKYGIEKSLNLETIALRNWHPLGHQNYVAGYLILVLPLLAGFVFSQRGWLRVGWLCGFSLSLATLYSTASRGGWLGSIASIAVFIGLSAWQYPKLRRMLFGSALASFGAMFIWGLSSDRIRPLVLSAFNSSNSGAPSYRAITNATGWLMGLDHFPLGAGLGSVTLLYQKYRPDWANREAELTYQLHSTPAQLWAELGMIGIVLTIATLLAIGYLGIRGCKAVSKKEAQSAVSLPLLIGLISGLAGYSIYAITDYQLDNICISGVILLFIAVLSAQGKNNAESAQLETESKQIVSQLAFRRTALAGASLFAAVCVWLYPVHRAWMLSSRGFLALQQNDIATFVADLEKAHQLAPWEPYYPYQLGWNLGELAFQSKDTQRQELLRQDSIMWFERAIALSPNREFGYSNLGWLQVNADPEAATQNFLKATQLVSSKRGSSFALGYSLLKEGKLDKAIQSLTTELWQQPTLLTSDVWESPELRDIYPQLLDSFENEINQRLVATTTEATQSYLYQTLGSLNWWKGDFEQASMAFKQAPTALNEALVALSEVQSGEKIALDIDTETVMGSLMAAWQASENRTQILEKAVVLTQSRSIDPIPQKVIDEMVLELKGSLENSLSFHDWIVNNAPDRARRNRRLGFGTISRHIDGPIPTDFSSQSQNIAIADLFPSRF